MTESGPSVSTRLPAAGPSPLGNRNAWRGPQGAREFLHTILAPTISRSGKCVCLSLRQRASVRGTGTSPAQRHGRLTVRSLGAALAFCLGFVLARPVVGGEPPADLSHEVQFELGRVEFAPGDSITIKSVRGTSDKMAVFGTYSVDGTYTLASHDEAELALNLTTTSNVATPVSRQQHVLITKGTGSFHLVATLYCDGYFHVSFYPMPSGNAFGGVYFGQGDRVLRSWSENKRGEARFQPASGAGPNQVLLDYLGNPVEPPANLDARYTKDGLIAAVQSAARAAGITVKNVAVDDSEFPFLTGVVCAGADFSKLKARLKEMNGYEYGGGIGNDVNSDGSDTCNVFSLVPDFAYPNGAGQQIYHRLLLRQQVFFARFSREE